MHNDLFELVWKNVFLRKRIFYYVRAKKYFDLHVEIYNQLDYHKKYNSLFIVSKLLNHQHYGILLEKIKLNRYLYWDVQCVDSIFNLNPTEEKQKELLEIIFSENNNNIFYKHFKCRVKRKNKSSNFIGPLVHVIRLGNNKMFDLLLQYRPNDSNKKIIKNLREITRIALHSSNIHVLKYLLDHNITNPDTIIKESKGSFSDISIILSRMDQPTFNQLYQLTIIKPNTSTQRRGTKDIVKYFKFSHEFTDILIGYCSFEVKYILDEFISLNLAENNETNLLCYQNFYKLFVDELEERDRTTLLKYIADPINRGSISFQQYERYFFENLEINNYPSANIFLNEYRNKKMEYLIKTEHSTLYEYIESINCSFTDILFFTFKYYNLRLYKYLEVKMKTSKIMKLNIKKSFLDYNSNNIGVSKSTKTEFVKYVMHNYKDVTYLQFLEFLVSSNDIDILKLAITDGQKVKFCKSVFVYLFKNNRVEDLDYLWGIVERDGGRDEFNKFVLVDIIGDSYQGHAGIQSLELLTQKYKYKWKIEHLQRFLNSSTLFKYILNHLGIMFHYSTFRSLYSKNKPMATEMWNTLSRSEKMKYRIDYMLEKEELSVGSPNLINEHIQNLNRFNISKLFEILSDDKKLDSLVSNKVIFNQFIIPLIRYGDVQLFDKFYQWLPEKYKTIFLRESAIILMDNMINGYIPIEIFKYLFFQHNLQFTDDQIMVFVKRMINYGNTDILFLLYYSKLPIGITTNYMSNDEQNFSDIPSYYFPIFEFVRKYKSFNEPYQTEYKEFIKTNYKELHDRIF